MIIRPKSDLTFYQHPFPRYGYVHRHQGQALAVAIVRAENIRLFIFTLSGVSAARPPSPRQGAGPGARALRVSVCVKLKGEAPRAALKDAFSFYLKTKGFSYLCTTSGQLHPVLKLTLTSPHWDDIILTLTLCKTRP
jgi:hypothetical protein